MSRYSKEDIVRMVREEGVEFIRMQFTDIFGQLKNVAITASQIEKAVNNQINLTQVLFNQLDNALFHFAGESIPIKCFCI